MGAINKGGAGTLQLAGANTYFGLTNVNGGILEANANTALGSIVSGTVIANGASLQVDGPAAETIVGESLQLTGTGYGLVTGGTELVNRGAWPAWRTTTSGPVTSTGFRRRQRRLLSADS